MGSLLWPAGSFIVAHRLFVAVRGLLSSCGAWSLELTGSVVAACGLSSCSAQALEHTGSVVAVWGLSSCSAQGPEYVGSVVAVGGLPSCGTWALESAGSVVVAHRLSCPVACGILVPRPGIEPTSPALEGGVLTTGPPGKSSILLNLLKFILWYSLILMNVP